MIKKILEFMPLPVRQVARSWQAARRRRNDVDQLQRLARQEVNETRLRTGQAWDLASTFSAPLDAQWAEAQAAIAEMRITDRAGGVNPGDRRAIFYLTHFLKPHAVLEIGTHIGASTVYFAYALAQLRDTNGTDPRRLTTVDILDVNDPTTGLWRQLGSTFSPRQMVSTLGCDNLVEFVTCNALELKNRIQPGFDLIFLDGDHSASAVYREIPLALSLLNQNGVILLHDYFPKLKQLWKGSPVIPGPVLATQRLINEGAKLNVIPLGELPWPTKFGSSVTSLALLTRSDS